MRRAQGHGAEERLRRTALVFRAGQMTEREWQVETQGFAATWPGYYGSIASVFALVVGLWWTLLPLRLLIHDFSR